MNGTLRWNSVNDSVPRTVTADPNATSRVVILMRLLADAPDTGLSVRAAEAQTGISKSAVQRILAKLANMDMAALRPDGNYVAGPAMVSWAAQLLRRSTLLEVADRIMRQVAAEVDETVCFAQFMPSERRVVFVHVVEIDRPVKYTVPVGSTAPFHAGAIGKAVLAWLPGDVLQNLPMEPYTPDTPQDRDALSRELQEIRTAGYAVSYGERYVGAVGIAAPVVVDECPVGAMSISVPRPRLDPDKVEQLGERIVLATRQMAEMMPRLSTPLPPRSGA